MDHEGFPKCVRNDNAGCCCSEVSCQTLSHRQLSSSSRLSTIDGSERWKGRTLEIDLDGATSSCWHHARSQTRNVISHVLVRHLKHLASKVTFRLSVFVKTQRTVCQGKGGEFSRNHHISQRCPLLGLMVGFLNNECSSCCLLEDFAIPPRCTSGGWSNTGPIPPGLYACEKSCFTADYGILALLA